MTTGEKIRQARKAAGITQAELAKRLNISSVNISQLENGYRLPKVDTLQKIATALGVEDWTTLASKVTVVTLYSDPANNPLEYCHDDELDDPVKVKIDIAYEKLNADGKLEALKRIEELTELQKYQHHPPTLPSI